MDVYVCVCICVCVQILSFMDDTKRNRESHRMTIFFFSSSSSSPSSFYKRDAGSKKQGIEGSEKLCVY